jgi:hypothetical protein
VDFENHRSAAFRRSLPAAGIRALAI